MTTKSGQYSCVQSRETSKPRDELISGGASLEPANNMAASIGTFNQSVENAGVAFVKGGDEINEFFEKETNSNITQTSQDEQGKGLTISVTN